MRTLIPSKSSRMTSPTFGALVLALRILTAPVFAQDAPKPSAPAEQAPQRLRSP
jgi:hypothetical protein